jgi:cytochrome c-type biogenesis protein
MENQLGLTAAFVAGLLSFLSPCILPLIPGYLTFITGMSLEELISGGDRRRHLAGIVASTIFFVAGFTTVFVLAGAGAGWLGRSVNANFPIITKVAAALIILFGLHLIGIIRIKWLYYEKRVHVQTKPIGLLGTYAVGLAFGFGWSPCVGPQLASILALASTTGRAGEGMVLLSAFSLGLAIPFLLTGLFVDTFLNLFKRMRRYLRMVEIAAGVLMVVIGILILTGTYQRLFLP